MSRIVVAALSALFSVGCASGPALPGGNPQPAEETARTRGQQQLVPPGYGTLKQDEVTVSLRSGPLLVKATPLDEVVIRLLAPDTYDRLHALAESRRSAAARSATTAAPALFLVSFFSYQPDIAFQPEDLQLTHQGRLVRAGTIVPITNGFGRQRLAQQESQTAIYVFDARIDYEQPIVVRYGFEESNEWSRIIPKLEVERARVRAQVR